MGSACKDCTTWEEDMYWTHFHYVNFSQFLRADFHRRLAIPKKVTDNLKGKLPTSLVLKGPGFGTWKVGLSRDGDTWFFDHGWGEFVKDNSLQENDFVVFKYNKQSSIDVLMFDGQSLCEKEASYFVRKYGQAKTDNQYHANNRTTADVIEVVNTASPIHARRTSTEQPGIYNVTPEQPEHGVAARVKRCKKARTNYSENITPEQPEQETAARAKRVKTAKRNLSQPHDIEKKVETGNPSNALDKKNNYVDLVAELFTKESGSCSPPYASSRRAVTEEEKQNALQWAAAASSADSFLVAMRPTHVYRRFYMSIPVTWIVKHLSPQNQDVILRAHGKTWRAKYQQRTARGTGGLTGGWKNFAMDNKLEEFDVCVFHPVDETSGPKTLDVVIFRVVSDFIPLPACSGQL